MPNYQAATLNMGKSYWPITGYKYYEPRRLRNRQDLKPRPRLSANEY